ncbi:MAG: toxin-antitoxin system, antitoxin component, Xre family protein [Ruminococcus sp.]|nr:toxin-antitoxin system, antitoxin component, Xre family protein [Ruminococcus sp.]MBR1752870.1 toxin-antitoxin system, antitoxin component, Xre family protein [Ruminococcus sp.]
MTDTNRLEQLIKLSGFKYSFIAKKLGISYQTLRNKLDNKSEFLPTEIEALCKLLDITALQDKNDIFFALFVDECSTSAESKRG